MLAASLLVASASVACGSAIYDSGSANPAAAEDTWNQLSSIQDQLTGTVEQRVAAQALTYLALQGPLRDCMRIRGFDYQPPPYFSGYESGRDERDFGYDDYLAPVDPEYVTANGFFQQRDAEAAGFELAARDAAKNPGYTRLDSSSKEMYNETVNACMPDASTYTDFFTVAGAAPLQTELNELVAKAQASAAVQELARAYEGCMAAHGLPGLANRSAAVSTVQARFVNQDPSTFHTGTPEWNKAAALEDDLSAADAACRVDLRDATLSGLSASLSEFETRNGPALAAVEASWGMLAQLAEEKESTLKSLSAHSGGHP